MNYRGTLSLAVDKKRVVDCRDRLREILLSMP